MGSVPDWLLKNTSYIIWSAGPIASWRQTSDRFHWVRHVATLQSQKAKSQVSCVPLRHWPKKDLNEPLKAVLTYLAAYSYISACVLILKIIMRAARRHPIRHGNCLCLCVGSRRRVEGVESFILSRVTAGESNSSRNGLGKLTQTHTHTSMHELMHTHTHAMMQYRPMV